MAYSGPQLLVLSCLLLLFAQSGFSVELSKSCHSVTYTVSNDSCDQDCVTSLSLTRSPCCNLSHLLTQLQNNSCVNITIFISNNQSLSGGLFIFKNVHNWTITGEGQIYINCDNLSGIAFHNSHYITLNSLHFVGCSAVNSLKDNYPLIEHAGLYFYKGYDVEIVRCGFHNSNGTGLIMNDVGGESNLITDTDFIGNKIPALMATGGGLIVRHSGLYSKFLKPSLIIEGCNFIENGNSKCYYSDANMTLGIGGGATFNLSVGTNITIVDSHFTFNTACQGGGLHIYQGNVFSDVNVTIESSTFENNHVLYQGGGIFAQQSVAQKSTLYFSLSNTSFSNNSGDSGAGLGVYCPEGNVVLTAFNSTWSGNSARIGGFAVSLTALPKTTQRPNIWLNFPITANFSSCKFWSNTNNKTVTSMGAVRLQGSYATFSAEFLNNMGTAIYVDFFSYAQFTSNNLFKGNSGSNSGALYIDKNSAVDLRDGVLTFQDNYATDHATTSGGAIYVEYTEKDDECVFESLKTLLNSSDTKIKINFFNNTAAGQNRSIFIGNANGCIRKRPVSMQDIILFDSKIFKFSPNETSQVASFVEIIEVYSPGAKDVINVMPGENFNLNLTVKDAFGNDAFQYGNIALNVQDKKLIPEVKLLGPQYTSFDNSTVNNALVIKTSQSLVGYIGLLELIYTNSSNQETSISIRVNLKKCKLGFIFQDQMCQCRKSDVYNLMCSKTYACVRYGYWYSNDADTMGMTIPCPEHNCDYHNGLCPNNRACPDAQDFCLLAANNSLCKTGRSGFLCSKCSESYAHTFASVKCVPNSTCSAKHTALLTLGLVAYWTCLVIFVLFILSVRLSIGSGISYGIMYYFSVIAIFSDNIHEPFLHPIISTSITVTNLSPYVLGNIPICFVKNWTRGLHHHTFYYVTPASTIFMIALVVPWSRFCPCPKSISPAQNTLIHAICLLILASYTSITFTNFQILEPTYVGKELRVYVDPELQYFHKEHLPYALVALFFEFAISLPICFLILFAPCLSRRVNMVKLRLKPILDEFQACYRPECRWFAGFYFLARQIIFLVNIIPTGSLPETNTYLHTINAVILIIHCSFQPYKQKWLNVLDTLLLADILFLSFFQLEYDRSQFLHTAMAYILIILPSLYLAAIVVLAILYRLFYCFQDSVCRQQLKLNREDDIPSVLSSANSASKYKAPRFEGSAFFRDDGEREPLLTDSVHSGQISYPHNRNSGGDRPFTTTSVRIS